MSYRCERAPRRIKGFKKSKKSYIPLKIGIAMMASLTYLTLTLQMHPDLIKLPGTLCCLQIDVSLLTGGADEGGASPVVSSIGSDWAMSFVVIASGLDSWVNCNEIYLFIVQ